MDELETLESQTIQSRATDTSQQSTLIVMLARTAGLIAPWWSTRRDVELRKAWTESDHFSGANYSIGAKLSSVPFRIEPRDPSIRRHWKQAEQFEIALNEFSEFGLGWVTLLTKSLNDLFTQDNGFFWEIIGDGPKDGPIRGAPYGIAHLDAGCCTRTGELQYPVVYRDPRDGKRYRLHHTRVSFYAQLSSPIDQMNGVGFCWFSRCLGTAQSMVDIMRYKQEKLGSRPTRAIIFGSGVSAENLQEAIEVANEAADNMGMARMARVPALVNPSASADVKLDMLDLASLPDGFDYEEDVTLGMFTIALCGGFPPRWLWPATVSGATKADALYQHIAGTVSGAGQTLRAIQLMIGGDERGSRHSIGKFLPPHLRFVFDFQDDELDRMKAEIKGIRSERHDRDVGSGIISIRVARQQMLADGDITEAQFEEMELNDGRTPDGLDISELFYHEIPFLEGIDPDNPDEALVRERLVEAKKAVAKATTTKTKRIAKQSVMALTALLDEKPIPEEAPEEPAIDEMLKSYKDGRIDAGDLTDFAIALGVESRVP